jgi:putative flippase GtrA
MPLSAPRRLGHLLGAHPATGNGAALFARNAVASTVSFAFDLAMLWSFKQYTRVPEMAAVAIAFLIAMTLHYALARIWVFRGSGRGVASGYLYFLVNAAVGLAVTLAFFWLLSRIPGFHYLASRALASVVAGIVVFLLNAVFNFRQLGTPRG